jgi:rhodanese-related sulfurtransferase
LNKNASIKEEAKMKIKHLMMTLSIGAMMIACNGNGDSNSGVEQETVNISGMVKDGYRQINMSVSGETELLTVYRGDYIKFYLDDGGDPRTDYQLDIPELQVSTVLKDNAAEQPYFKMKKSGKFQFRIGDRMGIINVVELRQANYTELSAEEAWQLLIKDPPLLLDVRTQGEFYRGYIKNATLIPLQELQARSHELEQYKNQPILIYCATGNRSTTAAKILLDQGFKNVMNLRMGIVGWASKGYDVQFR